jgi:uncharacterized repeat protein (TIGR03803 family)
MARGLLLGRRNEVGSGLEKACSSDTFTEVKPVKMMNTMLIRSLATAVISFAGFAIQGQVFTTIKTFGIPARISGYKPQSTLVQSPDGTLYGTAPVGEGTVAGTVFRLNTDGSGFAPLKLFTNSIEGANPSGGLVLVGSTVYGTTVNGGLNNFGTVFKVNIDGTGFAVLKSFSGDDGANPYADLKASGNVLYGVTSQGGMENFGTLFQMNTDGAGFTVLKEFGSTDGAPAGISVSGDVLYGTTCPNYVGGTVFRVNTDGSAFTILKTFTGTSGDGSEPATGVIVSGDKLYGVTRAGGSTNGGIVFRMSTNGSGYIILKDFKPPVAFEPEAGLALASGVLYGTTVSGGLKGTVYKLNTDGTGFTVLKSFTNSIEGEFPAAGVIVSGNVLYGTTESGGSFEPAVSLLKGVIFKVNTDGSAFATLKKFAPSDGWMPYGDLTVSDSTLYGTTYAGGSTDDGTVFQINTDATGYKIVKDLDGLPNGATRPMGGPLFSDGVLYGTSRGGGGANNAGTVFKVSADGNGYAILKAPTGFGGDGPFGGMVLSGGVLYGTTYGGGASRYGSVFKVNTNGSSYTVLKSFSTVDGASPGAGLVLSGSVLYGTTVGGGSGGNGTVFKINIDGTGFAILKSFTRSDGGVPFSRLLLSSGVLYGTTYYGGDADEGIVFKLNCDGTGFAVLKSFGGSEGSYPYAALVLAGSTLYGTTQYGGANNLGALFQMDTNGAGYTVLWSFSGADGAHPYSGLTLVSNMLYGTTQTGGPFDEGTIFKLDPFTPVLNLQRLGDSIVLSWVLQGFTLQSAPTPDGPFTSIPDAVSPYTNNLLAGAAFFRLVSN